MMNRPYVYRGVVYCTGAVVGTCLGDIVSRLSIGFKEHTVSWRVVNVARCRNQPIFITICDCGNLSQHDNEYEVTYFKDVPVCVEERVGVRLCGREIPKDDCIVNTGRCLVEHITLTPYLVEMKSNYIYEQSYQGW